MRLIKYLFYGHHGDWWSKRHEPCHRTSSCRVLGAGRMRVIPGWATLPPMTTNDSAPINFPYWRSS